MGCEHFSEHGFSRYQIRINSQVGIGRVFGNSHARGTRMEIHGVGTNQYEAICMITQSKKPIEEYCPSGDVCRIKSARHLHSSPSRS